MTGWLYMDSSALVKLVRDEPGSIELRQRVVGQQLAACEIAEVELVRSLARDGLQEHAPLALQGVYLYALDPMLRREACRLEPRGLRTLDALHLATALRLAPELDAFVCYHERLSSAAAAAGLPVEAPGR